VSSSGADPASRNAYLRLKGEVEEALGGIGFERVDILRPGLLLGPAAGAIAACRGHRPGAVDPLLNLLLRGSLDRYAGIDAALVARAMAVLAEREDPGASATTIARSGRWPPKEKAEMAPAIAGAHSP
jgi:uncharacterized protein YbjT (DUF2867 family)